MLHFFKSFRLSFRDQLMYGLGFVIIFFLSLFLYNETTRINENTRMRAIQEASEHSQALASMAKTWTMSNDYAGLEEVLDNFSIYNDLVFAAVINLDGKIIAHTNKEFLGMYISDTFTITFLEQLNNYTNNKPEIIWKHGHYIDVLRVIHENKIPIGMVHLRFNEHSREEQIDKNIHDSIGFWIVYVTIVMLLLYLSVNTISTQLQLLLQTIKKIHMGNKNIRADETGYNEIALLAHEFNTMLDAIKINETNLKETKERLEYAVNGTQDGLWDWNIQTDEVYFSPRWKEMMGYTDDELPNILETWSKNVHPDDLPDALKAVAWSHEKPGQLYENIHRIRHKSGQWIWILDRGQTLFNAEGKPFRMVGFHTDITKQKEMELELKEQEERMIAQSRHIAMGEMIGMIAHQWRQPITGIAMEANVLLLDAELGGIDNQTIKKKSNEILKLTQYLSKTIDDFRNFFRPKQEKDNSKILDILHEAQEIIGKSLDYHNITLLIQSNETQNISIYSREMLQVLLNLIKNAQEAIEQKMKVGGYIHATVEDQNDFILIYVSDNGGGIPDEIIKHIFEPYFSTKSKETGTGLGLYMSKTIIEKHFFGSIDVHNTDEGVTFVIKIPKIIE